MQETCLQEICRLCSKHSIPVFKKKQLGKLLVQYFLCTSCRSLQTESPTWIEEAYQNLNFAKDTGMVARTLFASHLILELAIAMDFKRDDLLLDHGGGTGLLTRILRDLGLNAFWSDKYAKNIFSLGFEKEISKVPSPKLITAFEVFEHLSQPKIEIEALLQQSPDFILFSTKLYQGQDASWWYLLEDGQHLQFYSKEGLELVAKNFNYHFCTEGSTYHLFSKKRLPSNFLKKICKKALKASSQRRAQKKWGSRTQEDFLLI